MEQTFRARLHTVEPEHGQHQVFSVHRLGELSLAALEAVRPFHHPRAGIGGTTYETIQNIPNLAWIEFDTYHSPSQTPSADETFLVTGAEPYKLTSTADILKLRAVPTYTTEWLRMLMVADRPTPPNPRAQTPVLREIVTLLPPRELSEYRAIAIAAMPHLAEYYKRWDRGIRPDDTTYTSITQDILARQQNSTSGTPWLELGKAHQENLRTLNQ